MAKRIHALDGIRAIAITAVFVNHAFQVRMLWMGVDLFFVLSGFLITGILLDQKDKSFRQYLGHFYSRRVRRILPPYLIFLGVGLLLYGVWWLRSWYFYAFLMNFMVAFGVPRPGQFDLLWSLAVEEQFYLLWPFAVYFLSEKQLARLAVALLILAPALRWICTPWFAMQWPIYTLTPFRMDTLAAGALIAIAWRKHRLKFERRGHYGLVLSAAALIALSVLSRKPGFTTHANTRQGNVWIYEMSLMACTGAVLWALSSRWVGLLKLAPLTYLGRISYSAYLIHLAIIVEAWNLFQPGILTTVAAAAATILYAACSWHFIEAPILGGRPIFSRTFSTRRKGDSQI